MHAALCTVSCAVSTIARCSFTRPVHCVVPLDACVLYVVCCVSWPPSGDTHTTCTLGRATPPLRVCRVHHRPCVLCLFVGCGASYVVFFPLSVVCATSLAAHVSHTVTGARSCVTFRCSYSPCGCCMPGAGHSSSADAAAVSGLGVGAEDHPRAVRLYHAGGRGGGQHPCQCAGCAAIHGRC